MSAIVKRWRRLRELYISLSLKDRSALACDIAMTGFVGAAIAYVTPGSSSEVVVLSMASLYFILRAIWIS